MSLTQVVAALNKNKFFRFLASVRLAVPTMLILCVFVAWGTILESMYNAEYASLVVYKSWWFSLFMVILWINIFCAPLSRYPFKKSQIGFVTTHLGLLILLAGGLVTTRYGVDGQLQVMEGASNSAVVLPRLMVGYQVEGSPSSQKLSFERSMSSMDGAGLDFINKEMSAWFRVVRYIPFAKVEKAYESKAEGAGETSVSFMLKSQFFNVTEWLSTDMEPEKQMGPATLRIVKGLYVPSNKKTPKPKAADTKRNPSSNAVTGDVVRVLDAKTEKEIQRIPVAKLLSKSIVVNGVTIVLVKKLNNAIVAENKLTEGDPGGANPALEFELKKGTESKREVSYAKHANFALNPDGAFGLRLQYQSAESPAVSDSGGGMGPHGGAVMSGGADESAAAPEGRPGGNVVEFHIPGGNEQKVQVVLFKNGEFVQEATVGPGESLQTPWMGMQIFIGTIVHNSQEVVVARPVELEKKGNLPPSAIELSVDSSGASLWLAEGSEREITVNNKRIHVFYGRENLNLPFEIHLNKFSKIDYPGTETPMSYESLVQVNGRGPGIKISMNEPLKIEGYTIYQASYSLPPNGPPISVFSVNKDPGRFWKYLGSVILSLGVIIYTLMKSRLYQAKKKV